MRPSRKRKRASSGSVALPAEDENESPSCSAKEADIWDAFREEYVESVEQLPLSIHRNFALLNEIDAQFNLLQSVLPLKIRDYFRCRQMLLKSNRHGDINPKDHSESLRTGKLLSEISMHTNDLLRATEEKVNLAKATYDAVDRHVRLLDQAIREHEMHSKNSPSVATVNLPYLPISGLLIPELKENIEDPGTATRPNLQRRGERNLRSNVGSRHRKMPNARLSLLMNAGVMELSRSDHSIEQTKAGDMPIDPNEPRYCYCGQVSWGEMIACDAEGCEREWFHLGCVGLTEAPKRGKWYCNECKETNRSGLRRRGQ